MTQPSAHVPVSIDAGLTFHRPTRISAVLRAAAPGRGIARRVAGTAVLLLVLCALGCAGGGGGGHHGGGGGGGGGGPTAVAITTRPASIAAGTTMTFSAQVTNDTGQGVTWTLSPASGAGTLSNPQSGPSPYSINYTAPTTTPNPNSVTIKATSVAAPALSDSVSFTITGATAGVTTIATAVPFPIFAGDPAVPIAITVANDAPGDVLTAQLTVDFDTGTACTPAACGSLGPVTGTAGSGNYTVSYTAPVAAGFTTQVIPTLLITSNLPGSFAATDYIEVDPAGVPLVTIDGLGYVPVGSAARTLTATVYNDPTHAGVTFMPLNAAGYACSNIGTNTCGALSPPTAPTVSGTTTTTTITYTPPAALPASPYDRPRIQAVSVADNTQFAFARPLLASSPAPYTGLRISFGTRFNSALALPSASAIPITANIGNDTGSSLSVNWTLTAGGTPCTPTCGMLGSQTTIYNGTFVSSTIKYTPPPSLPSVAAQLTPTITASSADNPNAADSFSFTISDGTCGTANNANLNGQYAFLLPGGGGANAGFSTFMGSFTANGAGGVTGGQFDANTSTGLITGTTVTSAGSSYSVGSDNRLCITLALSDGLVLSFRAGMGPASGALTQGRITHFDDNNTLRARQGGILIKQDPTSFSTGLSGSYALGFQGVDASGRRLAGAGALTASGGAISNLNLDVNDGGTLGTNLTGGSGTYTSVNTSGRGTATTTITAPGGPATTNFILYMVSSSEILFVTSDSLLAGKPIQSGELRQQSGSFMPNSLDNAGYVVYVAGVDPTNGGNDVQLMQATVTVNGSSTLTIDENDNGTIPGERTLSPMLSVAMNGRVSASGTPVFYLVDSTSGFAVSTDALAASGFLEKQVLPAQFSTASLSGNFFFGGAAPTPGQPYSSGTAHLDGQGNIMGTSDSSGPGGLRVKAVSPATGATYAFSATAAPPGKGTVGGVNSVAYAISSSKLVFMNSDQPELFIAQQ